MPILAVEASAMPLAVQLAPQRREVIMLSSDERESFAFEVIHEVRRWPGVEMRPHASGTAPGEADGVEFRLFGRQIGHVHEDCSLHLSLTKALKERVVGEQLAAPLDFAPTSAWAMFSPLSPLDAKQAIWLLRLNYIRLRRQRLTPVAAASSSLLREHEAALGDVSPRMHEVLQRTQARGKSRPFPTMDA